MSRCVVENCPDAVIEDAPFPICTLHAETIVSFLAGRDRLAALRSRLMAEQQTEPAKVARAAQRPRAAVVYYVQVSDVVKIGTTTDLKSRLAAYPPHARLLATEPGSVELEGARHYQFNEYLHAGREWFTLGPRLRDHIKLLASA